MTVQPTSKDPTPLTGTWWRFDRYEIRDGYIRPSESARLNTFEPWQDLGRPRRVSSGRRHAFVELASLVDRLGRRGSHWVANPRGGSHRVPGTPDDYGAVTDWCAKYGLFGLALDRIDAVVFPARWRRDREGLLLQELVAHQRTTEGWRAANWSVDGEECLPRKRRKQIAADIVDGSIVARSDLSLSLPVPGVRMRRFAYHLSPAPDILEIQPVDRWMDFLPGVPRGAEYEGVCPVPLTERFWNAYGEPVWQFFYWAQAFSRVLEAALALRQLPKMQVPVSVVRARGRHALDRMASGVRPAVLESKPGLVRHVLVAPTLAAGLAAQAMRDGQGGRFERCAHCGTLFIASGPRDRYCEARCGHASKQKRLRERIPRVLVPMVRRACRPSRPSDDAIERASRSLARAFGSFAALDRVARARPQDVLDVLRRHLAGASLASVTRLAEALEARP